MPIRYKVLLAAALLFWAPAPAFALRCGTSLVTEGQAAFEVLQRCGEPSYTDSHMEYRRFLPSGVTPVPLDSDSFNPGFPGVREVRVEEWIYNFGPTQLMASLIFENGRLLRIRTLGYGR